MTDQGALFPPPNDLRPWQRSGSLFDSEEGKRRRDEAIQRVGENASVSWKDAAREAVNLICRSGHPFTTDEVWQVLKDNFPGIPKPREPRAIGAIMSSAARRGLIRPTGEMTPSLRPEDHRRPVTVWEPVSRGSGR